VKVYEDFAPNFGDKKKLDVASQQRTVSHFFFCQGIFLLKHSPPTLLFLFPRLEIKLKGHHFDTIELIEAESQVVLNTFTGHNFQDAFKKCQKHWKPCIHAEGDYFKVCGGQ
jgi:hypothetical protein